MSTYVLFNSGVNSDFRERILEKLFVPFELHAVLGTGLSVRSQEMLYVGKNIPFRSIYFLYNGSDVLSFSSIVSAFYR